LSGTFIGGRERVADRSSLVLRLVKIPDRPRPTLSGLASGKTVGTGAIITAVLHRPAGTVCASP